jgi:hypothetical protein
MYRRKKAHNRDQFGCGLRTQRTSKRLVLANTYKRVTLGGCLIPRSGIKLWHFSFGSSFLFGIVTTIVLSVLCFYKFHELPTSCVIFWRQPCHFAGEIA